MGHNCPINDKTIQKLDEPPQLQPSSIYFSTSLLSVPLTFSSNSLHVLVGTGAFSSAITPARLKLIRNKNPSAISEKCQDSLPVKVASVQKSSTLGSVVFTFALEGQTFCENFLLLQTMNRPILRLLFFEKNEININPSNRTLSVPDMTLQLNEVASLQGTAEKSLN